MKAKYFRFMYCVTKSCFIHFGEVNDTKLDETVTFVYLKGAKKCADQVKSEHVLFLYPKYVDYAVLGEIDDDVEAALRELLAYTTVGTLVVPAKESSRFPEKMDGVNEIIQIGRTENTEALRGRQDTITDEKVVRIADHLERTSAGWKLSVRAQKAGTLAMLHMCEETSIEKETSVLRETGAKETSCGGNSSYDDCVMNVKVMDPTKQCCREEQPDAFGCALGCVLHQDYDVCKSRTDDASYLTGTLLQTDTENDSESWSAVSEEERERIRFFVTDGRNGEIWSRLLPESTRFRSKYYCIGTDAMDEAVAAVCRSGINRIPVVLQEGCGICCAGFLKYAE